MIVKTRIFELYNREYKNLSELAQAMGISVSQIYRVREGKRHINKKFIVGAITAFPNYKPDDLFYLAPELMEKVKVWYDSKGDFLEVIFKQKEGYFRETSSDQVMEKVDMEGNVIGFSILKVSSLKEKTLDIDLVSTSG